MDRKIIHIDMDCFYAAVEERDHPWLCGKPVAVAGTSRRGVLTTANYEARRHGCRSAMPVFKALELCPQLVLMPLRFEVYRAESARIRSILGRFTDLIEPLSLDEAYLDVTHLRSCGSALAREIRAQIAEETGLSASAGISCNKLLAKIASDWNKPGGQHEIRPQEVASFMQTLPAGRLWGVGGRMRERLSAMGVETCGDLQRFGRVELMRRFGNRGLELWGLCRGIDPRPVTPGRVRKSAGCETTFSEDVTDLDELGRRLPPLLDELRADLEAHHESRAIRSLVVKLKFSDFRRTTAERVASVAEAGLFAPLLAEAWRRGAGRPVRLLGVAVRFEEPRGGEQLEFAV
jgi:DNA polymerase-4